MLGGDAVSGDAASGPAARRRGRASTLLVVAKLAVSAGIIAWLLGYVDTVQLRERLTSVDPIWLGASIAATLVQIGLGAWRWQQVIQALHGRMSGRAVLEAFYAGVFWNVFLPGAVGGDIARGWRAWRAGLRPAAAVNSVFLDRLSTVLALLLVSSLLVMPLYALVGAPALVFPLLALGAAAGLGALMSLDVLPAAWRRFRLVRGFVQLSGDCRAVYLQPWSLLRVVGASTAVTVMISLSAWLLARGLLIDVTFFHCLLLIPPALTVTILPISIGGWGLREASIVFALATVGVAPEAALSLSVLLGGVSVISAVPGGLLWLRRPKEPRSTMTPAVNA